jgi:hypothetical protein
VGELVAGLVAGHGEGRVQGLEVDRVEGGLSVSFRWELPPGAPLLDARRRAVAVERAIRERMPGVARVLIRLEGLPPARDEEAGCPPTAGS